MQVGYIFNPNNKELKAGDRCVIFDPEAWMGKNTHQFKNATIIEMGPPGPNQTALVDVDIKGEDNG